MGFTRHSKVGWHFSGPFGVLVLVLVGWLPGRIFFFVVLALVLASGPTF